MNHVISLGGSIIAPEEGIDIDFIKKFAKLVADRAKTGQRFFIVTGGGATARSYQTAAKRLNPRASDFDLDWIGVSATKLNAWLLKVAFGALAGKEIITDPRGARRHAQKISVVSGWKPGWSTDFVATRIAVSQKVKTIINLSNIDYVYDTDPRKHKSARKFEKMTWAQFKKQFGSKWIPGANIPFDPVGAHLAQKHGITVTIMNGRNISNLENYLSGKKFQGTVIG